VDKLKILIVDDEESIRTALERWFVLRGYGVILAEDGVEAVEKTKHSRFDIVLMDLEMPRMNGRDAIDKIKSFCPDLPIMVFTGFAENSTTVLESGAAKVLTKPIRLRELEAEVLKILGKCSASSNCAGSKVR